MALKDYEFWLIVGSQHLYGEETLRQVKEHAQIMTEGMNRSGRLPCSLVLKPVAKHGGNASGKRRQPLRGRDRLDAHVFAF